MAMSQAELEKTLRYLSLTKTEVAALLDRQPRSVWRWQRDGIPRAIESALVAWRDLKENGLPWRPRSLRLTDFQDIAAILEEVRLRGGPASPWAVDLEREDAAMGPLLITFRRIAAPPYFFHPVSYDRSDAKPDLGRDRMIVQDGICRIAAVTGANARVPSLRGKRSTAA